MTGLFRKLYTLIILAAAGTIGAAAQELNCTVELNSDQVGNVSRDTFDNLSEAITEYMNTNKFSNAQIATNEKIECRLFLTVKSYDDNIITGDLQVQSSRPVYNSSYTTTLINFKDTKIDFNYQLGEPLIFSENSMESQLTAILNFYAYLILAVDFDSFSPRGGQPFWDRLATIVQMAQSSGEAGWKAFEDNKNRSAVLAAFTDKSTECLRDMLYEYHLQGLDQMSVSPDKGRQKITETLNHLQTVYNANSMSVGLSMFKDAKLDELINVYSKGTQTERDGVYKLLNDIYPTESRRTIQIKEGTENKR